VKRSQSRWEIRKAAARAFAFRNRNLLDGMNLREPDAGEMPLSVAEVEIGVRHGLISERAATRKFLRKNQDERRAS
jgi:hypothetical protein